MLAKHSNWEQTTSWHNRDDDITVAATDGVGDMSLAKGNFFIAATRGHWPLMWMSLPRKLDSHLQPFYLVSTFAHILGPLI